jgi:hypothetical protein
MPTSLDKTAAALSALASFAAWGAGAALPGDIVDASRAVVPAAYAAMAAQMGSDAGIAYRYGPAASPDEAGRKGLPTWHKRPDVSARNGVSQWQVGGPRNPGDATNDQAAAGSYSTNQANVLFVADDPAVRIGVADLQISGYEFNTYSQLPQLSWTLWGEPGRGIDSVTALDYRARGLLARPVAVDRCGGRAGFCATSIVAYQNGLLGTSGSNTARNRTTVKLAPNKVPTAVAMTGNSEFALVTVWDTAALKGQVAVVALAGLCDGCKPEKPADWYDWWHEWMGVYPGLPNMGNIAFMKVLGYVDLPGMAAPTEIAVTTGLDPFQTMLGNGNFVGRETPLTSEANRRSFRNGGDNFARYAKGGVAVVISKSEQKVAFIDLKPLFTYINSVYFGGDQAGFQATMGTLGQGETQWPHAFAHKPQQKPQVVKTVSLPVRPTAVRTTLFGPVQRAWVATQNGELRIFDLGRYVPGSAAPGDVIQRGIVAVGRNPTSLALSKSEPSDDGIEPLNQQVLVASRGERKIQWVRFSPDGNSGKVVRTLQDSRIADPIAVEDADNFATAGHVLSIADYAGKAISNYRYGKVVFADRGGAWGCQPPAGCGMGPSGKDPFEFGGSMAMPGRPFRITTANVP